MDDLSPYQALIMEHARQPQRYGEQAGATSITRTNPLCGDEITLYFADSQDRLRARFTSRGCALCRASASLMLEHIADQTPSAASQIAQAFIADYAASKDFLETHAVDATLNVDLDAGDRKPRNAGIQALYDMMRCYPARELCVLLPWQALIAGIAGLDAPEP